MRQPLDCSSDVFSSTMAYYKKKGGRVNEVQEQSEKVRVLETFNHQKQEG